MTAHIYSPAQSAMQSGSARAGIWILRYEPQDQKLIEPLMGYTSSSDTQAEVKLRFKTKEEAIAFAEKNGIAYRLSEPNADKRLKVFYPDNFRSDRKVSWTH